MKNCTRKAKKTLRNVIKARMDKRFKVVGSRTMTKKQKNTFLKGYIKSCTKHTIV